MYLEVKLCDDEGNEIDPPLCKCGNQASTCMMGKESHIWMCNECLYPNDDGAVMLTYKPFDFNLQSEYGGTGFQCALSEKQKEKIKIAQKITENAWEIK